MGEEDDSQEERRRKALNLYSLTFPLYGLYLLGVPRCLRKDLAFLSGQIAACRMLTGKNLKQQNRWLSNVDLGHMEGGCWSG